MNKGQVATVPQAQSPTQYAISFTPQDAKTHIIDLKFNGEPVAGNTFYINIVIINKLIKFIENLSILTILYHILSFYSF